MRRAIASIILRAVINPIAWASWRLGAFDRALKEAWLPVIFASPDERESTDLPWLLRSLRRVVEAAQPDTSSDCPVSGGGRH